MHSPGRVPRTASGTIYQGVVNVPKLGPFSKETWFWGSPVLKHLIFTYLGKFHHDLTTTSLEIMVSKGNHPQMAARFRLVNYYNLPRYIWVNFITTSLFSLTGFLCLTRGFLGGFPKSWGYPQSSIGVDGIFHKPFWGSPIYIWKLRNMM